MYWGALPNWFWTIYHLFLLITFMTSIFSMIRGKMVVLSTLAMIFTITIPLIGFVNSIGREEGMNEFQYLAIQLQNGTIWSVISVLEYLFLFIWWMLFLVKIRGKIR